MYVIFSRYRYTDFLPLTDTDIIPFSALTLLVGRQEGLAWLFAWSEVQTWHMSQLMPLPLTVSCFSKIQTGFTFLVPAHPGSPRQRPLNGCVCVTDTDMLHEWTTGRMTDGAASEELL